MHGPCRKIRRKALGPVVGRKVDLPAARNQLMRQRLGRKQMAAGPAGGQQDRALGHYSAGTARGGTRVSPI